MAIVTPEHQELFAKHLDSLGADLPTLMSNGQLVFRDASDPGGIHGGRATGLAAV